MTAKRLLAFLGAVALIVGAVFLRSYLDDRDSSSASTDGTDKPSGGNVTVICSTEFADICNQLDAKQFTVTIEPAGKTLDDLSAAGATLPDAWITLDPFPGMIDVQRGQAALAALNPTVVALATDVPQLAVAKPRAASYAKGCANQAPWKCVSTNAGKQWTSLDDAATTGKVIPGLSDPATEASGLVEFANMVGGYFTSDAFTSSDWLGNADFNGWLRNLQNNANVTADGATPLSALLVRSSNLNVAATTGVELAANPQPGLVVAVAAAPAIPIVAVVATFRSKGSRVEAAITQPLVTLGWTRATDQAPQLPPGTFIALRTLWEGKS